MNNKKQVINRRKTEMAKRAIKKSTRVIIIFLIALVVGMISENIIITEEVAGATDDRSHGLDRTARPIAPVVPAVVTAPPPPKPEGTVGTSSKSAGSGNKFMDGLAGAIDAFWRGTEPSPPSTPWYQASPEDIQTCKAWGGKEEPNMESSSGISLSGDIAFSQLTLTVQAEKTILPDNTTLYQIAWYVEPFQSSVTYSLSLQGLKAKENKLVPSSSAGSGGSAEFFPFYAAEDYDRVVLTTSGSQPGQSGTMTVPIVITEGLGLPTEESSTSAAGSTGSVGEGTSAMNCRNDGLVKCIDGKCEPAPCKA